MLDVDGTIVSYHKEFYKLLPSKRVTEAIQQASKQLTVCFTTGRPYSMMTKILSHIKMEKGYAIINDGAQVIDLASGDILYERVMSKTDIRSICSILKQMRISFFINDNEQELLFTDSYKPEKPLNILVRFCYAEKTIDKMIDKLTHIPLIKANKTHGGEGDNFGLVVSHAEATKLHGIYEVSKLLGIKRVESIGVGDSGNDFSLLMACGLKVAMGNALPALKEIADYVAPSVEDDGVADVIEKFVLNKNKNNQNA